MSQKLVKERIYWIDFLRGIAIFLVVAGHQKVFDPWFFVYTSPIKMPLFFFLSGLFFRYNDSQSSYFKHLFYRLIIPWLLLPLPIFLINPSDFFLNYYNLIVGKQLWFMVCFIIDSIIVYYIIILYKNNFFRILQSIVLVSLGLYLSHINSPNLFMINTALVCQSYILISFILKDFIKHKLLYKIFNFNISVFIYLFLCFIGYELFRGIIDVHTNNYFNIFYCFILIYLGIYLCLIISKKYFNTFNLFTFFGKNSLLIYIWSSIFITFFYRFLELFNVDINNNFLRLALSILTCILISLLSILFRKYFPFIIGEKKIKGKIVEYPNL